MSEENYYVKVMVDGVAVSNSDLCGGNPWSNNCKYRVSLREIETVGRAGGPFNEHLSTFLE